jgi:hypothetical protein
VSVLGWYAAATKVKRNPAPERGRWTFYEAIILAPGQSTYAGKLSRITKKITGLKEKEFLSMMPKIFYSIPDFLSRMDFAENLQKAFQAS